MRTLSLFPESDELPQLTITDTQPTSILKDFAIFTGHLKARQVTLSKSRKHIPDNLLHRINEEVNHPWPGTTAKTAQFLYPLLHFFYHLVLAGRLFEKRLGKGRRLDLIPTARLESYEELSPTEQYFFLLETFWVDTDWDELCAHWEIRSSLLRVQTIMEYLGRQKPGQEVSIKYGRAAEKAQLLNRWNFFLIIFSHYGFWDVVPTPEPVPPGWPKYTFMAEAIIPRLFGIQLASILAGERDIDIWNLPRRWETGEHDIEIDEPFFRPFVPLFPGGALEKTLPREKIFIDGTYVFEVALDRDLWRRIEISAKGTLFHLHQAIQKAFGFDDDHLYSFFMDGNPRSRKRFVSPWEDDGPSVDQVRIGELNLFIGQEILYLFDYGDEWHFRVTVEDIRTDETQDKEPAVTAEKGAAPEQYGLSAP